MGFYCLEVMHSITYRALWGTPTAYTVQHSVRTVFGVFAFVAIMGFIASYKCQN